MGELRRPGLPAGKRSACGVLPEKLAAMFGRVYVIAKALTSKGEGALPSPGTYLNI